MNSSSTLQPSPSHDWAARQPFVDFDINAVGTLNLLEAVRLHAEEATFIFTSTNKVYGDRPNSRRCASWKHGGRSIPSTPIGTASGRTCPSTSLSIASSAPRRSLPTSWFRSTVATMGSRTACFRGGTLTGPHHSAAELHGFLAYVMRCAMTGTPYTVYGYKGKQVRDAVHSRDLIRAFHEFFQAPRVAEIYNIGGGRFSNASVIEAIEMAQDIGGSELVWTYEDVNRIGDHIWWIGDNGRFESHYPAWKLEYDVRRILEEIRDANRERWRRPCSSGRAKRLKQLATPVTGTYRLGSGPGITGRQARAGR